MYWGKMKTGKSIILTTILFIVLFTTANSFGGDGDLVFEGIFEFALDIPRTLFLMRRDPNGDPLLYEGSFETNYGFLDTGASGLLLSRETVDLLGVVTDPCGQYLDVGVGGYEVFDVSEPLYFGSYLYTDPDTDPCSVNPDAYFANGGPWRCQIKQTYAGEWPDEPIDLMGMPLMAGHTVVFYPGQTNDLGYFLADIVSPNSVDIPAVDFNVPVRFEKYITTTEEVQSYPLPVLGYNPVIENAGFEYNGSSSSADLILDTGGTISLVSSKIAFELGLVDEFGEPIVTPDFESAIGGIGGAVTIYGYELGSLAIQTLNGYKLIYTNPRVFVHDISLYDEDIDDFVTLDGIFGSNFMCASAKLEGGLPVDLAATPYEHIVLDTQKGLLGFDVYSEYPVPSCGDAEHPSPVGDITGDCVVNDQDCAILVANYGRSDCGPGNDYCDGADLNTDTNVNVFDLMMMHQHWLETPFGYVCGQVRDEGIEYENPWAREDINRDCVVDFADVQILLEEWQNGCDALNWQCRGADINGNGMVDFADYSAIVERIGD